MRTIGAVLLMAALTAAGATASGTAPNAIFGATGHPAGGVFTAGLGASVPGDGLTFSPSGAPLDPPPGRSPGAGETLYLDWVSPLQAPRGLEMPVPGKTAPLPPALGAAAQPPAATPVPEPASLGLLAIGLLPFAPLVCRRRHTGGPS